MPLPKVSLVVLNWNNWEDTRRCLASLARLTYRPVVIIVVDNGSRDGSPDRIAEGFPTAKLLRLPKNKGYGGGMNAGIEAALAETSDFVLCLNNDMTVDPGFLEPLATLAAEDRTVPFPAVYQGQDPDRLENAGNHLSFTGVTSRIAHGSRDIPSGLQVDYTELPFLPRGLLEHVGPYREDYFAFYEDVDLGLRIRAAGWHFRPASDSRVYHRPGSTTRRIPGLVSYYGARNRLLLIRDNGTPGRWVATVLHVLLLTLPFQILNALADPASPHKVRDLLRGLWDGLLPWRRGVTREWPPAD